MLSIFKVKLRDVVLGIGPQHQSAPRGERKRPPAGVFWAKIRHSTQTGSTENSFLASAVVTSKAIVGFATRPFLPHRAV